MLTRLVSSLAAIVIFITTYALVLPAITLEAVAACGLEAHQHDDSCFEEVLICTLPESGEHRHTDDCYGQVLTCGKEVHVHTAACYQNGAVRGAAQEEAPGVGVTAAGTQSGAGLGAEAAANASANDAASASENDAANASASDAADASKNTAADASERASAEGEGEPGPGASTGEVNLAGTEETDAGMGGEAAGGSAVPAQEKANAGAGGGTADDPADSDADGIKNAAGEAGAEGADAVTAGAETLPAGYIPPLEALYFDAVLTRQTGMFCKGAAVGSAAGDGASDPAAWTRIGKNTKLGRDDLLRAYLAYSIPAGSLNETNAVARYRLPDAFCLTDEQVDFVNNTVNGIAAQYVNADTLEILDPENYEKYLGMEAVEGTRLPDEDEAAYLCANGGQEFISATVKVENLFDESTDAYAGQDLVITFVPYTLEKNRNVYDEAGQPVRAGEKVCGWIALDILADQVNWEQAEQDLCAQVVFSEKDAQRGSKDIRAELRMVERISAGETEAASAEMTEAEAGAAETASVGETEAGAAEVTSAEMTEAGTAGTEDKENKEKSAEADRYPAAVFDDSITVRAGSLSTDAPAFAEREQLQDTEIRVHVEAEEGTFPEGTAMVLSAVDDMDAVAEAVAGAIADTEKDDPGRFTGKRADGKTGENGGTSESRTQTRGFHAVDISFRDKDGRDIEPRKPVRVSMTSEAIKRVVEDDSTAPVVVHIQDTGEAADSETGADPGFGETAIGDEHIADEAAMVDGAARVEEMTQIDGTGDGGAAGNSGAGTLTFEAGAFSVYAIVYTVDFHWEAYTLSIPGGTYIWLSDLLEELSVQLDVATLASVEFSDSTLVGVEYMEADGLRDWRLSALQAFSTDERLTMTAEDGTVYVLEVTDDAGDAAEHYSDLGELLKSMTFYVDGEEVPSGAEVDVRDGILYDLVLNFQEKGLKQFEDVNQLYFSLPDGFTLPDGYSEKLTINLGLDGKVYNNLLSYDKENNRLLLDWNKADRKYKKLIAAGNLKFTVHLQGYIEPGEVSYGELYTFTANRYDPENASVAKTGVLDSSDMQNQKMNYTVTVVSDGSNSDLTLFDVMGSALTYSQVSGDLKWSRESRISNQQESRRIDATAVGKTAPDASEENPAPYLVSRSDGSMVIRIPEMKDGDVITFTYTADVDYNKISSSGAASAEEMANTVRIYGDSDPADNIAVFHQKNVVYSDIVKSTAGAGARYSENGRDYQDIEWTIDTNRIRMISFAGTDITDTLTEYDAKGTDERNLVPMKYTGSGIVVKVYETEGEGRRLVETRTIPWAELGTDADLNPKNGWSYRVPDTDGIYEYEITYTTRADVTDLTTDAAIINDAMSRGGEDKATTLLHPTGKGLGISKRVLSSNDDITTWEIVVTVDDFENGAYDKRLVLTDVLPTIWGLSTSPLRDNYVPDSLEIFGLKDSEGYQVYYSDYTVSAQDTTPKDGSDAFVSWNYRNLHRYYIPGQTDSQGRQIYPNDDGGRNALYIWFYQDEACTKEGLQAPDSGNSRTLRVRISTYNNEKWTEEAYASKNITSTYLLKHQNNAYINTSHELAEVVVTGKNLYKKYKETDDWGDWWRSQIKAVNGIEEVSGQVMFRFETYLSGVKPGDRVVLDDVFDPELFCLFDRNIGIQPLFRAGDAPHYAKDVQWKSGTYGASYNVNEDGTVTFDFGEVPLKSDGTAYNFYGVEYYLIMKNQDAYDKIQLKAFEDGGIAQYVNTAKAGNLTDSDTFPIPLNINYSPLDKSVPEQSDVKDNTVPYTIVVNPQKLNLNNGDSYTVDDEFEGISVDYATIRIATEPAGRESLVSYDFSGNTGTFTVPDETMVTISYKARIIVPKDASENEETEVTVSNVASMFGWESGGSKQLKVTQNSSANIYRIRLFKYGSGHMESGLNGAVFGLYKKVNETGNDEEDYQQVLYPSTASGDRSGQHVTFTTKTVWMYNGLIIAGLNGKTQSDLDAMTDAELAEYLELNEGTTEEINAKARAARDELAELDGYADMQLSQSEDGLSFDEKDTYYLREESAPEGYTAAGFFYKVTFSKDPDYDNYEFYNNDILKARNSPEDGSFVIKKVLSGNYALNEVQKGNLKFTVQKLDGSEWRDIKTDLTYDQIREGYTVDHIGGAGIFRIVETTEGVVPANVTQKVSFTIDEIDEDLTDTDDDGKGDEIRFEITSSDIENGREHTIAVTNAYDQETVTLKAVKKWVDAEGLERAPDGADAELGVFVLGADGIAENAEPVQTVRLDGTPDVNSTKVSGESSAWTAQFAGLPAKDGNGNFLRYAVKEISVPEGFMVSYDTEAADYLELSENSVPEITNRQESTTIKLSKEWISKGGEKIDAPEDAQVVFGIYQGISEDAAYQQYQNRARPLKTVTLSPENDWQTVLSGLPLKDGAGEPYVYIAIETSGYDGYTPVYTEDKDYCLLKSTSDGSEETNTIQNKEESVVFRFHKIWRNNGEDLKWSDAAGENTAITVMLYNNYSSIPVGQYTLQAVVDEQHPVIVKDSLNEFFWSAEMSEDGKDVCYTVSGLPAYDTSKKKLTYYVKEYTDAFAGCHVSYGFKDRNGKIVVRTSGNADRALNDDYIINTVEDSYSLPATGGPGTRLFTILGSILIAGAGLLLWRRRRLI